LTAINTRPENNKKSLINACIFSIEAGAIAAPKVEKGMLGIRSILENNITR